MRERGRESGKKRKRDRDKGIKEGKIDIHIDSTLYIQEILSLTKRSRLHTCDVSHSMEHRLVSGIPKRYELYG